MSNQLMPLYYAIIKQFMDGREYSAETIMAALKDHYGSYKLFTRKDTEEALATAKENGLLEESSYSLDEKGKLLIGFRRNASIKRYT